MSSEDFAKRCAAFSCVYGYTPVEAVQLQRRAAGVMEEKSFSRYLRMLTESADQKQLFMSQFDLTRPYIGRLARILADENLSCSDMVEKLITYPMSFSNLPLWFLYTLLEISSFGSASLFSQSSKSEGFFTGSLFGAISGRAAEWRAIAVPILARARQTATLGHLDLQIAKREPATGGDTLLMVETTNAENRREVIPLILQSKRYEHRAVRIDQKNDDGTYQFHVLRERPCPAAYIAFQSRSDRIVYDPMPPLVREVSSIPNVLVPGSFSAWDNSLTIGSFILGLISSVPPNHRFEEAGAAFERVLPDVRPEELANVVVFSTEQDAQRRFQEAWTQRLIEIDRIPSPDPKAVPDDFPFAM